MLNIDILAVIPEILESPFNYSIIKRAKEKNFVSINVIDLRKYAINKYGQIDDYQYGGGAGMVIRIEPVYNAIEELKKKRQYDEIIYLTPDGEQYTQRIANELSTKQNILLLCGRYKGIDQRIRDYLITREISIGDYVLSGGELAAAVLVDSIVRLIPGVLGDEESALTDSFQDNLLSPPVYTRPREFKGWKVPDILLSGNSKLIEQWRLDKAIEKTKKLRPDLYKKIDDYENKKKSSQK